MLIVTYRHSNKHWYSIGYRYTSNLEYQYITRVGEGKFRGLWKVDSLTYASWGGGGRIVQDWIKVLWLWPDCSYIKKFKRGWSSFKTIFTWFWLKVFENSLRYYCEGDEYHEMCSTLSGFVDNMEKYRLLIKIFAWTSFDQGHLYSDKFCLKKQLPPQKFNKYLRSFSK